MNPQEQQLLAQLKDVAQPASPGWWPLAPGWWLLIAVVTLLLFAAYKILKASVDRKEKQAWRRAALDEHQQLFYSLQNNGEQKKTLAALSVLMRRVALAVEPRSRVAVLTDKDWLLKLDAIGQTTDYSRGVGELLHRHQYQRDPRFDGEALTNLFKLTESTIKTASPKIDSVKADKADNQGKSGGASVAAV